MNVIGTACFVIYGKNLQVATNQSRTDTGMI